MHGHLGPRQGLAVFHSSLSFLISAAQTVSSRALSWIADPLCVLCTQNEVRTSTRLPAHSEHCSLGHLGHPHLLPPGLFLSAAFS